MKGCWERAGKDVRADVGEAVGNGLLSQGSSAFGAESHIASAGKNVLVGGDVRKCPMVVQKVLLLSVQEGSETYEDLAVGAFTIAGKARAGGGI